MPLYQYLISYRLPADIDQASAESIAEIYCRWLMEESVCSYTRGTACFGPDYRIEHRFQFETLDDWLAFVERSGIDRDLFTLHQSVEEMETSLWKTGDQSGSQAIDCFLGVQD